jgi:transcriptional regulator with XRE-family HTH domain
MKTPFQQELSRLIARYEAENNVRMTGTLMGSLTGRSRNHLSNIMNDGLVPSAEATTSLCRKLGATDTEFEAVLMAGLRTKSDGPRDLQWLKQAVHQIDRIQGVLDGYVCFLQEKGLADEFQQYRRSEP